MDIQELQQKLLDLESFYGQRNVNFLAWRNLYFMREESIWRDENDEYIAAEPDEVRLVLPIALNVVEGFRELLLTKPPAISVPPPTASGEELIDAEHNERTLLALWDRAEIYDRLRDSLWHGLVDGWGVLQVLLQLPKPWRRQLKRPMDLLVRSRLMGCSIARILEKSPSRRRGQYGLPVVC